MLLGIYETLENIGTSIRDFLISMDRNPVVWVGMFILGVLIFFLTYNALHKD